MPKQNAAMESRTGKEAIIFQAACRVIRHRGFHQARMADIAREAGISYGLVYHYYKNKADLLDAIIEEWWRGLNAALDRRATESSAVEDGLRAIVGYFLDQYEERPDLVHVFITEISRSTTNLTPEHLKRFKDLMARTGQMIAQAQGEGTIRTDVKASYLSYLFLGAVETLLTVMVLEDQPLKGQAQKQRMINALMTTFFDGARARSSS